MTNHAPSPRSPTRARAIGAFAGMCALLTLGGCLSSARDEFIALRADAPKPVRATGTTLAEAEMSNVGPTRPPAALVGVGDRNDR